MTNSKFLTERFVAKTFQDSNSPIPENKIFEERKGLGVQVDFPNPMTQVPPCNSSLTPTLHANLEEISKFLIKIIFGKNSRIRELNVPWILLNGRSVGNAACQPFTAATLPFLVIRHFPI